MVVVMLVGCQAEATPIAFVEPPTPTVTVPAATLPPPLRYALLANAEGRVPDLAMLQAATLVDQLRDSVTDAEVLAGYDVIAGYGALEGWSRSPVDLRVLLILHPDLAPLGQDAITNILRQSIDPAALATATGIPGAQASPADPQPPILLRERLANRGHPDGFGLTLAYAPLPGVEALRQQLRAANFETRAVAVEWASAAEVIAQDRAHLLLHAVADESERAAWVAQVGAAQVVDLYALPIRYLAAPDLTVTFTPYGFPLPSR